MITDIFELLEGLFTLITVIFSIIISIDIAIKYKDNKEWHYLAVGAMWAGMYIRWFASSINFVLLLFTDIRLPISIYIFIIFSIYQIVILMWLAFILDIFYKKKMKIIFTIGLILVILFEIYFLINITLDPSQIASYNTRFSVEYNNIFKYYFIISGILLYIGILVFTRSSLRSNNQKVQLRGKFLLIGAILLLISIIIEQIPNMFNVVVSLIQLFGAVNFFFAFIMPEFITKRFLKDQIS